MVPAVQRATVVSAFEHQRSAHAATCTSPSGHLRQGWITTLEEHLACGSDANSRRGLCDSRHTSTRLTHIYTDPEHTHRTTSTATDRAPNTCPIMTSALALQSQHLTSCVHISPTCSCMRTRPSQRRLRRPQRPRVRHVNSKMLFNIVRYGTASFSKIVPRVMWRLEQRLTWSMRCKCKRNGSCSSGFEFTTPARSDDALDPRYVALEEINEWARRSR